MKSILAQSEWWFLERLDYGEALLVVEVVEGCVSPVSENIPIEEAGTIPDARPIEVTEQSRRVRVKFSNVLAHQVTDESYAEPALGKMEELAGRILCQHTGSEYVEYVQQNSLIEHLIDDPVHHYRLNLADDIIDVITTTEPCFEPM